MAGNDGDVRQRATIAEDIGRVLGTSAEVWLTLQSDFNKQWDALA